jgi:hypothetical protein
MKRIPYTNNNDKTQDKETTKGLDKEGRAKFEKLDKAHGKKNKPESQTADRKIDEGIVNKIKKAAKKGKKK